MLITLLITKIAIFAHFVSGLLAVCKQEKTLCLR